MNYKPPDESIAYHVARLMLLISKCGTPQGGHATKLPGIEGRTLLAKLDFFLRYPAYLRQAGTILGRRISDADLGLTTDEDGSVESRMIRYLYGPWDHIYYPALGYLVGKELVIIEGKYGTEIFRLTLKGQDTSDKLAHHPAYADLARRAETANQLFSRYTGTRLKSFIYNNFPEVVSRDLGETI